jgi:hypothetical protein
LTVQIDESLFSKRKYNRARSKENLIVGGIFYETNDVFVETLYRTRAAL